MLKNATNWQMKDEQNEAETSEMMVIGVWRRLRQQVDLFRMTRILGRATLLYILPRNT